MATYTYKCSECDEQFEVVRSMKDDALTDCIKCNKKDSLNQIIMPAGGFRLRGVGFFKPTASNGRTN